MPAATYLCTLISTSALAQIYECTDSRGNHSYSEVPKGKNCHSVSNLCGNFSTTSAYKPAELLLIPIPKMQIQPPATSPIRPQFLLPVKTLPMPKKHWKTVKKFVWEMNAATCAIRNA